MVIIFADTLIVCGRLFVTPHRICVVEQWPRFATKRKLECISMRQNTQTGLNILENSSRRSACIIYSYSTQGAHGMGPCQDCCDGWLSPTLKNTCFRQEGGNHVYTESIQHVCQQKLTVPQHQSSVDLLPNRLFVFGLKERENTRGVCVGFLHIKCAVCREPDL